MSSQQQKLKYNYVKNEIENYEYYLAQIARIDKDLAEITDAIDEPRVPGSVIRMFDKVVQVGSPNWINDLLTEEKVLELERQQWQDKVDRIDKWLMVLSPGYRKAVQAYVIENKCRDAEGVADRIGYTKRGLTNIVLKSIKKIGNIF